MAISQHRVPELLLDRWSGPGWDVDDNHAAMIDLTAMTAHGAYASKHDRRAGLAARVQGPGPRDISRARSLRRGHRRDAPGRDRRSSTHTVATVSAMANEASAMRLAPVQPRTVAPEADSHARL